MLKRFLPSVVFVVFALSGLKISLGAQQEPTLIEIGGSRAYIAGPEDASVGVIVVHDWFGISEMTRETVSRLGSMGYRTVAVDLYHGESATDHGRAGELLGSLEPADAGEILDAAIESLSDRNRSIGLIGFSAGAFPALQATAGNAGVSAMVGVYGGNLEQVDSASLVAMSANVLLISGSVDGWAMGSIESVQAVMASAGKAVEVYVYPNGGHGFAQPLWNNGATLDSTATRVSWMLIDDFLERHLPGQRLSGQRLN
jgi:carboxymethylenebutenolidase